MPMKKSTLGPGRFARFAHACLAAPARFLLRVRVTGRENIPAEGGHVLIANHTSFLDPIVLSAAFPRRRMPKYLAKRELFRIPILSTLVRAFGGIPLERGGSDVGAVHRAIAIATAGDILTVFPQGTRRKGQNPANTPVKAGAAMIAARAGVPILPVCIRMKKQKYALFRRVDVIVGEPISPEALGLLCEHPDYKSAATSAFLTACALGGYQKRLLTEGEE